MRILLADKLHLTDASWLAYRRCNTLAGDWVCHAGDDRGLDRVYFFVDLKIP